MYITHSSQNQTVSEDDFVPMKGTIYSAAVSFGQDELYSLALIRTDLLHYKFIAFKTIQMTLFFTNKQYGIFLNLKM